MSITKSYLKALLYKYNLNKSAVAKILGIQKQNINYYMKKYNLKIKIERSLLDLDEPWAH